MALVCIHETEDVREALVITNMLEAYGLYASVSGLDLAYLVGGIIPPLANIRIMVSDQDVEAARAFIGQAGANSDG